MFVTRKDHWLHLLFAWRGTVLKKYGEDICSLSHWQLLLRSFSF